MPILHEWQRFNTSCVSPRVTGRLCDCSALTLLHSLQAMGACVCEWVLLEVPLSLPPGTVVGIPNSLLFGLVLCLHGEKKNGVHGCYPFRGESLRLSTACWQSRPTHKKIWHHFPSHMLLTVRSATHHFILEMYCMCRAWHKRSLSPTLLAIDASLPYSS